MKCYSKIYKKYKSIKFEKCWQRLHVWNETVSVIEYSLTKISINNKLQAEECFLAA